MKVQVDFRGIFFSHFLCKFAWIVYFNGMCFLYAFRLVCLCSFWGKHKKIYDQDFHYDLLDFFIWNMWAKKFSGGNENFFLLVWLQINCLISLACGEVIHLHAWRWLCSMQMTRYAMQDYWLSAFNRSLSYLGKVGRFI